MNSRGQKSSVIMLTAFFSHMNMLRWSKSFFSFLILILKKILILSRGIRVLIPDLDLEGLRSVFIKD